MKISEVIKILEWAKKEHGDNEVTIHKGAEGAVPVAIAVAFKNSLMLGDQKYKDSLTGAND